MVTTFKTLHFHQLSIYERELLKEDKNAAQLIKHDLDKSKINAIWDEIIHNKTTNNCVRIQEEFDTDFTTLEILNYDDTFIFGRMGKEKDMRSFHLREEKTFKSEQIQKRKNQIFEVFTYVLIDRSNFIISYLHETSAPSILKIGELISNLHKSKNLFGEVASVSVADAIPFLSKKDSIGTITYKTTLPPSDSRLWNEEITGLDRATYDKFENLKNAEFTIKLVAERNKDTFPNKGFLGAALNKISGIATKVKVKAKNENEYTQDHDLIDNPLTKKVKFDFDKELQDVKDVQNDIYKNMLLVYNFNKSEVVKYCKTE